MQWFALIVMFTALVAGCASGSQPSGACLPGASFADGACRPNRSPTHRLPFRPGYRALVSQGFHGPESHHPDQPFSVDFACKEGEPVVASADGVVWNVKEDSDSGCTERSCLSQANYVILDHGDGTYSHYNHLLYRGALVEVGDQVCQGEVVGLCGNTGYSSNSHLHYSILDAADRTLPFRFEELRERGGTGIPVPATTYTSDNQRQDSCGETEYSQLGEGAFAHNGIVLDKPLPLVTSLGTSYVVSGRFYGDQPKVSMHRKSVSGTWLNNKCISIDEDGRFEWEIDWPSTRYTEGRYYLMITGSTDACESPDWAWSPEILVRGE